MPFQPAARVASFGTSIFTEFTQLANKHQAIDLSTGYPNTDGPEEAIAAVIDALRSGHNQYALSYGEPSLRQAVAQHALRFYGQHVDPDTEITVTNGAAEALHTIADGIINPGDEVIILEPFYEVYPLNITMAGGVPRFVPLRPPQWTLDPGELATAFNDRTRAILINTPHNPTGKVFSRAELETIAALCQQWNVIAITDEVYEHIVYDGAAHLRMAQLPGMAERTITISSLSKTFSFTGWRIGWVIAPPDLTRAIRLAHQYVLDCSATPIQYGATAALTLDDDYYTQLADDYALKRDLLATPLRNAGLSILMPQGGYFIMAGIDPLGFDDDFEFCRYLIQQVGIAAIPPSVFFSSENQALGKTYVRFAFCKTPELLQQAQGRLANIKQKPS